MTFFAKTRKRNKNGTFTKLPISSGFDKKEYKKQYHILNKEKLVRKAVEWGRNNPEKRKLIKSKWVKNNREKVNYLKRSYMYRRKQKLRQLKVSQKFPSLQEINDLYTKYLNICAYCFLNKATTIDHIIPLIRGGSNEIDNLVPACVSCNSSKGGKLLSDWKPIQ